MNKIIHGNCLDTMSRMPDDMIDLTVTSPPYDNLRDYKGYDFDFESIAKELFRVTKKGGVVVWIVGDATIKGSETGTSFKQALYFKEIGFNLHDTMIYQKSTPPLTHKRYEQNFEYMFILVKGKIKTFNPIMVNKIYKDTRKNRKFRREKNNIYDYGYSNIDKKMKIKVNIWNFFAAGGANDFFATNHPAVFPEQLANDHIISWSNEGDLIYDPMAGSGTTLKMAKLNNRNYIGSEISEEYCKIAEERLNVLNATL